MPTHRSNGPPETHENVGGLDWRWHAAECPSRCEERYIVGHIDELGETWKKSNANKIPGCQEDWLVLGGKECRYSIYRCRTFKACAN